MAWSMVGKPTTQVADHQLVERFATMTRFGGDRPLNKTRCARLRSLLEEGRFRTCAWAVCHCRADGKDYRVNGQHTSHVLAEFNGSLPAVFVTVERYEADTIEDVAELFGSFDPGWSNRTTSDTNNAYASSCKELEGIPSRIINLAASGLVSKMFKFTGTQANQDVRGKLLIKNAGFVRWLNGLEINSNTYGSLRRAAPAAAMFACYQVDPSAATEFWLEVKTASAPVATAPSRVLEKFLSTAKARIGDREMYAKSIYAWNAFRRGQKELKCLKFNSDAPLPEAI